MVNWFGHYLKIKKARMGGGKTPENIVIETQRTMTQRDPIDKEISSSNQVQEDNTKNLQQKN